MSTPQINIMVALHSEAKPLIDHFKLKPGPQQGFRCFSAEYQHVKIQLVVTGIGQQAMSTAVGWLAGRTTSTTIAWLNVGSAGHRELPVGTAVRVAHCESATIDNSCYPPLVTSWSGEIGSLLTGDQVTTDYPPSQLVDMEGSAFFAAAHRFSAAELVQAIKVISDNQATDINNLSGAVLTELIQSALQEIVEFIDKLIELLAVLPENSESLLAFMDRFKNLRMTVTQRRQFRELAASLINAGNIDVVSVFSTADYQDARALLSELRLAVESNPPVLHVHD